MKEQQLEIKRLSSIPHATHAWNLRRAAMKEQQSAMDYSRLWQASMQFMKAVKNRNLHVIVHGCIAMMIGLLNIYTDVNLKYS